MKSIKPKLESIKTFLIVILAAFCSQFWFAYKNAQEILVSSIDFTQEDHARDVIYDFKVTMGYIQKLESGKINDVKHLLYYSGILDLERVDEKSTDSISSAEIEEFRTMYYGFMKEQCSKNDYGTCVRYGDIHLEQAQYDLAHSAYLKAAQNENYDAMSRLAYLHANESWANSSEAISEEWFRKIGTEAPAGAIPLKGRDR